MSSSIFSGETNADRKKKSREASRQSRKPTKKGGKVGLAGLGLAVTGFWTVGYFLVGSHQIALVPFSLTPSLSDGQELRDVYGIAIALIALPFSIAGYRSAWGKAALALSAAACGLDFLVYTTTALYRLSLG